MDAARFSGTINTKTKILVECGSDGRHTRYRVSRGALLQHIHSAWLTDSRLRDRLADEMRRFREQVKRLEDRIEDVEVRVAAIADAAARRT